MPADDWPSYQHDASHTGRSSASFDPRDLQLAWSAPPDALSVGILATVRAAAG